MMKNKILTLLLLTALPGLCCSAQKNVSLRECLELSHSGSHAVVNAGLDVASARSLRQEAAANRFPTLSFTAGGFHAMNPLLEVGIDDIPGGSDAMNNFRYFAGTAAGLSGLDTQWPFLSNAYVAGLTLSQPVYAGGRIATGNALAALGVRAAELKNGMAVRDNDDEVTRKYWLAVSLSEKKTALQQALDLVSSLESDVRSACEAGLARESDLMQVRLKSRELESQMIKLRSMEKLAKMDLFNLIGMEYKVLELDEMHLSDRFDDLLPPENYYMDEEEAAGKMEESELLEMSVESKKLEKKMALGECLPQIGVGASLGYGRVIGNPQPNALVYAMVKVPISDWAKTSAKLRRCTNEIEKAERERSYLDSQLRLKASKEWIELRCAWDRKEVEESSAELYEDLEKQKEAEYAAGLCTVSELLQTQTELQSARSDLIDSQIEYCNALAVWLKD